MTDTKFIVNQLYTSSHTKDKARVNLFLYKSSTHYHRKGAFKCLSTGFTVFRDLDYMLPISKGEAMCRLHEYSKMVSLAIADSYEPKMYIVSLFNGDDKLLARGEVTQQGGEIETFFSGQVSWAKIVTKEDPTVRTCCLVSTFDREVKSNIRVNRYLLVAGSKTEILQVDVNF